MSSLCMMKAAEEAAHANGPPFVMEEVSLKFYAAKRPVSYEDHLDVRVYLFSLSPVNPETG
jgi:hypothetical protein